MAQRLTEGRAAWEQTSTAAGRSYFYWRIRPAGETGIREVTGVQIQNGRVTARYVTVARMQGEPHQMQIYERHRESGARTGQARSGFPPRTMEQLYERCTQILPEPGPDAPPHDVRIDNRGVLNVCYRVERGCMDDCSTNIGVDGLVLRQLNAAEIEQFLNTSNPSFN